jgi:CheY-like chemotaxis protein
LTCVNIPARRRTYGAILMMSQRKILVVDDDLAVQESLEEVLLSAGYCVSIASNGRVALDRLQTSRPDVILLDLMMPVMDGWQFRDAQKRDHALADIPVIIISAAAEENAAALGGVAARLPKPFSIDVLLRTVGHAAAGRRSTHSAPEQPRRIG